MTLALFTFLAWESITIFAIIPKYLNKAENVISFFIVSIVILTLFPMVSLNTKLIWYSKAHEMFFSLILYRNIILPLILLIFVNYFFTAKKIVKRIGISVMIFLALLFIEYLTIWTGVRKFTGWQDYQTIIMLAAFMIFTAFLGKSLRRPIGGTEQRAAMVK